MCCLLKFMEPGLKTQQTTRQTCSCFGCIYFDPVALWPRGPVLPVHSHQDRASYSKSPVSSASIFLPLLSGFPIRSPESMWQSAAAETSDSRQTANEEKVNRWNMTTKATAKPSLSAAWWSPRHSQSGAKRVSSVWAANRVSPLSQKHLKSRASDGSGAVFRGSCQTLRKRGGVAERSDGRLLILIPFSNSQKNKRLGSDGNKAAVFHFQVLTPLIRLQDLKHARRPGSHRWTLIYNLESFNLHSQIFFTCVWGWGLKMCWWKQLLHSELQATSSIMILVFWCFDPGDWKVRF